MTDKLINHFVVCLDRSGSMQPIQKNAVDAFNQNVNAIREGAKSSNQTATVTLITFGGDIREEYFCVDVNNLKTYDYQEYQPNGGTPLFDAVGMTIRKFQDRYDANDPNVSYMFVIITDGEENTSQFFPTWKPSVLNDLIHSVQKTDRWSFAFLLPPRTAHRFCASFQVPEGNVREWEANARGMASAAQAVSTGINSYYVSRAAGKKSVSGFFVTDMSKVSVENVQQSCIDMKDKVNVWQVPHECVIRSFVEERSGQPYKKGNAYYQLTKDETIQPYKQIFLIEKGKSAVYAGTDARRLLGLPDAQSVKVRPGNHANWDIFVQSTSVNRKLVRGTRLVYLK